MRFRCIAITLLAMLADRSISSAQSPRPVITDSSLRAFLPTYEAALQGMIHGKPAAWLALVAREPTLFPPFGGVRSGRAEVLERYAWAAAHQDPTDSVAVEIDYLAVHVSGDLAYVSGIERSRLYYSNGDATGMGYTRVTLVFRREDGAWKLAHRHMDHLGDDPQAPPP